MLQHRLGTRKAYYLQSLFFDPDMRVSLRTDCIALSSPIMTVSQENNSLSTPVSLLARENLLGFHGCLGGEGPPPHLPVTAC